MIDISASVVTVIVTEYMLAAHLSTSEYIDLAIALATLGLAGATFSMARGTTKLARITQQQHDATITPVVRVARIGQPSHADICTVNEGQPDEALVVVLENHGPTAVEIEKCALIPGGNGEYSDPDQRFSPVMQRGDTREFDFKPSEEIKARIRSGERFTLRVTCMAVSSGSRYQCIEFLKCDFAPGNETWSIIGSQAPQLFSTS